MTPTHAPISPEYLRLMARYGQWMNRNLYVAAASLSDVERKLDRGAFFKNIHATLCHLLWGDTVWMHRLASTAGPNAGSIAQGLDLEPNFDRLRSARESFDEVMIAWADRCTASELVGDLTWFSGAAGRELTRPRWVLCIQLFNHGTHHRGQVHAMLTAAGARTADTDIQLLPESVFQAFISRPGRD